MAKTRRRRPPNRTKRRPPTREAAPRLGDTWQAAPTRTYVRQSKRARRQTMIRAGIAGGAALGFLIAVFVIVGGGGGKDTKLVSRPVTAKVLSPTVKFSQGSSEAVDVGTGDKLSEGAVVETDETGLGEFRYADGSLMRVGQGSKYKLDKTRSQGNSRDILGTLTVGKTWHRVTPKDADYSVKVLGATGTVVGTSISVVCPAETDCFYTVVKGKMRVEDAADRSADLEAGDQVEVKFGRLDPVRRLTAEEMAADPWISQNLMLDGENTLPSIAETTTTVEGETTTTLLGVPGETTIAGAVTGSTTRTTARTSGGTTPPGTSPPGPGTTQGTTATTTDTTATTAPPAPTTTRTPQQQAWCDNHKKDPRWAENCS